MNLSFLCLYWEVVCAREDTRPSRSDQQYTGDLCVNIINCRVSQEENPFVIMLPLYTST
jgi:hypothetical protein